MRFPKLLCREVRKAMQKEGLNLICPQQIHDLFVGQNRICKQASATHQQEKNNRCRAERRKAPSLGKSGFQCMLHLFKSGQAAGGSVRSRGPVPALRTDNSPSFCYAAMWEARQSVPASKSRSRLFQAYLLLNYFFVRRSG